jgi:hypothetical protein
MPQGHRSSGKEAALLKPSQQVLQGIIAVGNLCAVPFFS